MVVTPEEKELLKERGQWGAYVSYRAWLRKEGYKNPYAENMCREKFLTTEFDEKAEDELVAEIEKSKELPECSDPVELIRWVAGNLGEGEMNMATCPGKDALALLRDCRSDAAFRIDFWKTMFTKILPSRATLSDKDEVGEVDGSVTIGLLGKIKGIAERAKEISL